MLSKFTNIFLTLKYIKANYDFQDCWILSLYYSIKFYCYWLHINKRLVRKTYIYHKLPFCFYGHYNIQTIKRLFISLHDPSNFILLHPSKFQILNKASSIGLKIKKNSILTHSRSRHNLLLPSNFEILLAIFFLATLLSSFYPTNAFPRRAKHRDWDVCTVQLDFNRRRKAYSVSGRRGQVLR